MDVDETRSGHSYPVTEAGLDEQIHEIDRQLSVQLFAILHHEKFRRLEAAWRGIRYLVSQADGSSSMGIEVLSVTKRELLDDLTTGKAEMRVDRSEIHRHILTQSYTIDGKPYGALLGDFSFRQSQEDVKLLTRLASVAASAHAPFLAAADPDLLSFGSFSELRGGPESGIPSSSRPARTLGSRFQGADAAAWNAFRNTEESRYVALTLPRVALRQPWVPSEGSASTFQFTEHPPDSGPAAPLWGNAAWALGACILRAFGRHAWCARIRGVTTGGKVEGISPLTERTAAGTLIRKPPLELALSEHQEAEIAALGLINLSADPETAEPVFFSTPSLHRPPSPSPPSGSAAATGAELSVQLHYTFARSRFVHYLKRVMLAQIGRYRNATELTSILNAWLQRYVLMREGASEEEKAERPLRSGRIEVVEDPGRPGRHWALIYLRPHFQMDLADMCPRAVVEVPVPLE